MFSTNKHKYQHKIQSPQRCKVHKEVVNDGTLSQRQHPLPGKDYPYQVKGDFTVISDHRGSGPESKATN